MSDPFMVPVPPGATHVDLRPALTPFLRALAEGDDALTAAELDDRIDRMVRHHKLALEAERLRWEWIRAYMLKRNWRGSMVQSGVRQYYPDKDRDDPYGYKPHTCVILKEDFISEDTNLVKYHIKAVCLIARWEAREPEEVIADIWRETPAVDALASVTGRTTS